MKFRNFSFKSILFSKGVMKFRNFSFKSILFSKGVSAFQFVSEIHLGKKVNTNKKVGTQIIKISDGKKIT